MTSSLFLHQVFTPLTWLNSLFIEPVTTRFERLGLRCSKCGSWRGTTKKVTFLHWVSLFSKKEVTVWRCAGCKHPMNAVTTIREIS